MKRKCDFTKLKQRVALASDFNACFYIEKAYQLLSTGGKKPTSSLLEGYFIFFHRFREFCSKTPDAAKLTVSGGTIHRIALELISKVDSSITIPNDGWTFIWTKCEAVLSTLAISQLPDKFASLMPITQTKEKFTSATEIIPVDLHEKYLTYSDVFKKVIFHSLATVLFKKEIEDGTLTKLEPLKEIKTLLYHDLRMQCLVSFCNSKMDYIYLMYKVLHDVSVIYVTARKSHKNFVTQLDFLTEVNLVNNFIWASISIQ